MKSLLCLVLLPAVLSLPAAAEDEPTGPSFDCAKASGASEMTVCDNPGLGWYDRQVAKSYAIAKKAIGGAGEPALEKSQTAFRKTRDACGDNYDCVDKVYVARIAALLAIVKSPDFSSADYAGDKGRVSVLRYPDDLVAVTILTAVGKGLHMCFFETDRARAEAGGRVSYAASPDAKDTGCKITIASKRDGITVSSSFQCSTWCGTDATLDGTFKKVAR
jgi:uncharacterized protein